MDWSEANQHVSGLIKNTSNTPIPHNSNGGSNKATVGSAIIWQKSSISPSTVFTKAFKYCNSLDSWDIVLGYIILYRAFCLIKCLCGQISNPCLLSVSTKMESAAALYILHQLSTALILHRLQCPSISSPLGSSWPAVCISMLCQYWEMCCFSMILMGHGMNSAPVLSHFTHLKHFTSFNALRILLLLDTQDSTKHDIT